MTKAPFKDHFLTTLGLKKPGQVTLNMLKKRPLKKRKSNSSTLPVEIHNPELVFGILGPIGVDLEQVITLLQAALAEVEYKSSLIHLTSHMKNRHISAKIDETSYYSRYMSLIRYANEYRKLATTPAALAGLAIAQIRRKRSAVSNSEDQPDLGTAFIVRQFKRPEEIELMRRTYGRKFVQVSVYGSETNRKAVLINKIRHFDPSPKSDADCESQALKLIEVDNNQVDDTNGQRVSDVFHLGDVFVDGIDAQNANKTIRRFIRALFGDNRISPNKDEYGLYTASAAALRSVDLSRQVGAAIFTKEAEVLALGCNEVPKAKGGTYWADDTPTIYRDIDTGTDANQDRKNEIFYDLVHRLSKEKFLSKKPLTAKAIQSYVDRILDRQAIKDSQFMDILEFGRMIHAEMSAISDAARLGRPTKNFTLFCTTFPCHICAKHIVAAGIDRVVFLEPYPKSYAKKLHDDSITFDPNEKTKVIFQAFIGISPRRYRDIFEKKKRKDKKHIIKDWYEGKPIPRIEDRSSGYIENEGPAIVYALGTLYSLKNTPNKPADEPKKIPANR